MRRLQTGRFAQTVLSSGFFMTMKDNYQKNVWPWNTARVVDHLNEIIYDTARENIDVVIRANPITGKYGSIENLEDAAQFCQDLVGATNSPIVFRKTFFLQYII